MSQPDNFSLTVAPTQVGTYLGKIGDTIAAGIEQYNLRQGLQQAAVEAARLKAIEDEKARLAALQYESDLQALRANPSGENLILFSGRYPKQAEGVRAAAERAGKDRAQAEFDALMPIFVAADAGDMETAKAIADERVQTLRNAGKEAAAKRLERTMSEALRRPEDAMFTIGLAAEALNPERFKQIITMRAERDKTRAEADAEKEKALQLAVDTKYQEQIKQQGLALTQSQLDTYSLDRDIKRENQRIKLAQRSAANAPNDEARKKAEADAALAEEKRAQITRDKKAELDKALAKFQAAKRLAQEILDTPLKVKDAALGTVSSLIPNTFNQPAADFVAKVETLEALGWQSAVANVGSMAGVSNTESLMMAKSQGSLALNQSVESFDKTLRSIIDANNLAEEIAKERYGASVSEPAAPPGGAPAAAPGGGAPAAAPAAGGSPRVRVSF